MENLTVRFSVSKARIPPKIADESEAGEQAPPQPVPTVGWTRAGGWAGPKRLDRRALHLWGFSNMNRPPFHGMRT